MSIATVTINSSLDGPRVVTVNLGPRGLPGVIGALESYATHDAADAIVPVLCEGGEVVVTWIIADLCDAVEVSGRFILIAPLPLELSVNPADAEHDACEFEPAYCAYPIQVH
jgi:hypothetical protein